MYSRYLLCGLLAAITMVSATTSSANSGAHKNVEGAVRPDPAQVSGRSVIYFSVSQYALAELGVTLAYSVYNAEGDPVIFYDEESLAKLPEDFQRWIFGHELAHFRLGHFEAQNVLYQKSLGFEGVQHSFEHAADCAAVKMLKEKESLTSDRAKKVAQTAQTVFHGNPLQRVSRITASNHYQQFRYDSPSKRAENIIACFEAD